MPTNYDGNALANRIAQGDGERSLDISSKFGNQQNSNISPFVRVVVLDIIFDPNIIDNTKLSWWENELGVSNLKDASVAPRNSIIGKLINNNGYHSSNKTMVFYPFFSHLSLPVKPGEHVWAMFENPEYSAGELGYWISKIAEPHFVDDVNHTHSNRKFDPSFLPGIIAQSEGKDTPVYEFPPGAVQEDNGARFIVPETVTLLGDEKSYEKIITEADASKLTIKEPIPRYRKRPSETTLEGSNNTLITLGTTRKGPVSEFSEDQDKGKQPKLPSKEDQINSGQIDIVTGRGQTEKTSGKKVTNSIGKEELGKSKKELVENEGEPDYKNDRSRILLSMNVNSDEDFEISQVVSKSGGSSENSGYIVVKTDRVRIVARKDIVILVAGSEEKDNQGNVKDTSADPSKCASITLKTSGDIVFTPSDKGVIKLGGENASLTPLCITGINAGGSVTASPLVDSMGGSHGSGGLSGEYPKKILMQ